MFPLLRDRRNMGNEGNCLFSYLNLVWIRIYDSQNPISNNGEMAVLSMNAMHSMVIIIFRLKFVGFCNRKVTTFYFLIYIFVMT